MISLLMLIGNGWRLFWKVAIVFVVAIGLRALLSELKDLLKIQSRHLVSEQRVEMSLEPERHTSFENHRFLIRSILASKTMILELKTPISGLLINRYQDDILTRPQTTPFF